MNRGRVHLPDLFVAVAVFAAAVAVAPVMYSLVPDADPVTVTLMEAVPALVFIGIVISVGVSAVRRD